MFLISETALVVEFFCNHDEPDFWIIIIITLSLKAKWVAVL